jgi:hypothetical protein
MEPCRIHDRDIGASRDLGTLRCTGFDTNRLHAGDPTLSHHFFDRLLKWLARIGIRFEERSRR